MNHAERHYNQWYTDQLYKTEHIRAYAWPRLHTPQIEPAIHQNYASVRQGPVTQEVMLVMLDDVLNLSC